MARTPKRGRSKKRKTSGGRARGRFETAVISLLFLGAGALLASFWLEWRDTGLEDETLDAAAERAQPIRVEILNGVGEAGVAGRVRELLRDQGFDVVSAENADHFDYRVTHVINRSGIRGAARRVADELGVDSVAAAIDPDLFLDATVILGRDWRERLGITGAVPDPPARDS